MLFLVAFVGSLVVVAAVILYHEATRDRLSGFRVDAPLDKCWSGTVASHTVTNVSGCGPAQLPVDCQIGMVQRIDKIGPGN